MTLAEEGGVRVARGEFEVDQRDFELGLDSQATDRYVAYPVTTRFRFDVGPGTEASDVAQGLGVGASRDAFR